MWWGQHIYPLFRRMGTVQTTTKPPSFTPCPAFYPVLLGADLWMPWNTLISPLKKWSQAHSAAGAGLCCFLCSAKTQNLLLLLGERKAQELKNVGKVDHFVPGERGWRAGIFSFLIPSFFRAEIPMNTRNVRLGSAFLPAVQPSLRTPNNSQPLVLLDSLETPGCNGCNYELMALNPPSDLMPSSPVWFLFPFCLLTAVPQPQLFVISH